MIVFPFLDGLSPTELQAIELDGECYRMAQHRLPIGFAPTPELRALAALAGRPRRLIAALDTAAWIWGARPQPLSVLEFIVTVQARWRPTPSAHLRVIESVCRPEDVTRLGGRTVTTPLRTAVDIARFGGGADGHDDTTADRTICELARIGGFTLDDAETAAAQRSGAVRTHDVCARLRAALSPN